jgi:hypothetical protein
VLFDGEQRRLGVQRVENGLDQQEVGAAFAEPADGFGVGADQFVEAGIAVAGVVDVRRDRRGARGRPETPATKRGLAGLRAVNSSQTARASCAPATFSSWTMASRW